MSTKLERLTFTIDLLERVSGPLRKVQRVIGSMADASEKAFAKIGMGAAGVAGAGYSLLKFVSPAEEMRQALGEVDSLDVSQNVLKDLSAQGLQYSIKYGRAADGFVRSAYDIQSAINGLQGNELGIFTNAGNVLATATKSDAGTITNYMGTMYGIFQDEAKRMGKGNWIEQLTGQTATAVQMFKTTGGEMSAAFTSVGANAKSFGIGMAEQMAVLGKLQATMSGSEAGTKYKSFLAGVGKAQKKLGLTFVDSNNNLLGMTDILGLLKGKFGDTLNVAESDALKDAFGSDEAVSLIKLLMADTDGLTASIDKLGKVKGMEQAERMASKMVTPLQRLTQGFKGVTIGIGNGLAPTLDPLINGIADAAATMTKWLGKFPNISRWLGYIVLAVIALTGVMAGLTLITGLTRLGFIGLGPSITAAKWALGLFTKHALLSKLASLGLWAAMLVGKGVVLAFKGVLLAFQGVMWLVNAAMAANPAVLITLALIALVGAVAAVIYWWDDLKAAFMDSSWGQAILDVIDTVLGGLKNLTKPLGWVMDKIGAVAGFLGIGGESEAPSTSPSLEAPRRALEGSGGMATHIAKTIANNRSDSRSIGQVTINTEQPMTKQALDELLFAGS